jgi:hypothetical protein
MCRYKIAGSRIIKIRVRVEKVGFLKDLRDKTIFYV